MRGKIVVKDGRYDTLEGWIPAEYDEVDIISVFWHPIEGPQVAAARSWGEIEYFPIHRVEVLSQ